MGSPCEVCLYTQDEAQAKQAFLVARSVIAELEARYSRYRQQSLVSKINRAAGSGRSVAIDSETEALLDYADQLYHQSDGLFDITSGVLRRAWNFKVPRLPSERQLSQLLPLIGWHQVERARGQLYLPKKGMELDFGGIVKEYAADAVARRLYEAGLQHALVDLGGDIRVLGPMPNGRGWRIGIRNPNQARGIKAKTEGEEPLKRIQVVRGAITTSGGYERYMTVNGKRYGHILNPKTGWPIEDGLSSVTVLSEHCVLAGSLSTIAMLMGEQRGKTWLDSLGVPYIVVTHTGMILDKLNNAPSLSTHDHGEVNKEQAQPLSTDSTI